jgi:hypothetical protein
MSSAAVATPAAAAAAAAAPDLAAIQKELADTKVELGETRRAAEFYERKSKETPAPAAAAAAADPDDDIDILEVITTKGKKGLDDLLAKSGFVRKADVDKAVEAKTASVLKQQDILKAYPDLADKKSEFFKDTAEQYGILVKQGVDPDVAMGLAAERVELVNLRSGKTKSPGELKADKDRDRKARIAAQGGEGVGRTPTAAEEEDEDLTPEQEQIVRKMLVGNPGADGKPMNFEQATAAYKARAKTGVAMKGIK